MPLPQTAWLDLLTCDSQTVFDVAIPVVLLTAIVSLLRAIARQPTSPNREIASG